MNKKQKRKFINGAYDKIITYALMYGAVRESQSLRKKWREQIWALKSLISEKEHLENVAFYENVTNCSLESEE